MQRLIIVARSRGSDAFGGVVASTREGVDGIGEGQLMRQRLEGRPLDFEGHSAFWGNR